MPDVTQYEVAEPKPMLGLTQEPRLFPGRKTALHKSKDQKSEKQASNLLLMIFNPQI